MDLYDSVDVFKARAYERVGADRVPAHLETTYGVRVAALSELDGGVFRIDRDDGPPWVARLFSAARPFDAVVGDAEILQIVAAHDYPAERCAAPDACSELEGQGILVTEYVEGANGRGDDSPATLREMGELLGRLHTLPAAGGAMARPAGSWHSLSIHGGARSEDITVLQRLFADVKRRVSADQHPHLDALTDEVNALDTGEDLPTALTHPDFVTANVMKTSDGDLVLIDWTGAGTAPRIMSLGLLLSTIGNDLGNVDAIVTGYRRHARLEADELDRLPDSIRAFGLILGCWGVVNWGAPPGNVVQNLGPGRAWAEAIAARARDAFAA